MKFFWILQDPIRFYKNLQNASFCKIWWNLSGMTKICIDCIFYVTTFITYLPQYIKNWKRISNSNMHLEQKMEFAIRNWNCLNVCIQPEFETVLAHCEVLLRKWAGKKCLWKKFILLYECIQKQGKNNFWNRTLAIWVTT